MIVRVSFVLLFVFGCVVRCMVLLLEVRLRVLLSIWVGDRCSWLCLCIGWCCNVLLRWCRFSVVFSFCFCCVLLLVSLVLRVLF